jgi:hypothetical protein
VIEEAEAMPGLAMISAGALDDTGWLNPEIEILCGSAQIWVSLGERQCFQKMPG